MGMFYVNYALKGIGREVVVRALSGRKAFVSVERDGCVFVFDEQSDGQDETLIARVAGQLSSRLRCTVWAVLNHDSDILWYELYESGRLTDKYNSTPDYWSPQPEPALPKGGDAERLCKAFGASDVVRVEAVLRATQEKYPEAADRHSDLLAALDLPGFAVGYGFDAIRQGYLPEGMSVEDFVTTS